MALMMSTSSANAQNIVRDSLNNILRNTTDPRLRIDAMNAMAYDLCTDSADKSLALAQKTFALAQKINYHKGMGMAKMWEGNTKIFGNPREYLPYIEYALSEFAKDNDYLSMSVAHCEMSRSYLFLAKYDSALICTRMAVNDILKDKSGNFLTTQQLSKAYWNHSSAFYMLSSVDSCFYYALKAVEASEKINDPLTLCLAYSALASALSDQGKYDLAVENYKRSLPYYKSSGSLNQSILAYLGLYDLYRGKGMADSALYYVNEALDITTKNNLYTNFCTVYWYRAELQADPNEALKDYQKALDYARKDQNQFYLNQITLDIAEKYFELGQKEKAALYANEVLAASNGDISLNKMCYNLLYRISTEEGDYKNALRYHELFMATKDSIFNEEKNRAVEEMNTKYETEKKENQILLLGKDNVIQGKEISKQKILRNTTMVGLAGVLIFLIVVFLQKKKISKEKARSEELLLNILPYETAQELKAKGSADAKLFDEVTVLFTDFKGFTMITESLSPQELVAEIHTCFKAFDEIMERYTIEKIKTIGDAYMAAGGLPVQTRTNAVDVVHAAIEIRDFMQRYAEVRRGNGKPVFEIRIGIHTGPVVAGIVGVKKFAYDIWGDTVNIASRMESSGEAGQINISGATYEHVKEVFVCTARGKVNAKNKGEIEMYFVQAD